MNNETLITSIYQFLLYYSCLLLSFVYLLLLWELYLAVIDQLLSMLHILLRLHYLCLPQIIYVYLPITWIPAFFRVFWTNTSLQRPVTPRVMYFTSKWRATTSDICLRWLPETPALVSFSLVLLVSVTKVRLWSLQAVHFPQGFIFFIFILLRFYF